LSAGGRGGSLERPGVQQAFGRSLAEEGSLSFRRAQGLGVVAGRSLRNARATESVAKSSRLDPEHSPGYDCHARLVTSRMASIGERLPARAQLSEGRLLLVLPIGGNKTRKVRDFIALPRYLRSTAALQEIIRGSEGVGRRSAGIVG
jgi:hypothetical protein